MREDEILFVHEKHKSETQESNGEIKSFSFLLYLNFSRRNSVKEWKGVLFGDDKFLMLDGDVSFNLIFIDQICEDAVNLFDVNRCFL